MLFKRISSVCKSLKLLFLVLFLFSCHIILYAQVIDNISVTQNIKSSRYVRFHYDNDLFVGSDIYYSQGINLEIVSPGIAKIPATHLLFRPAKSILQYGLDIDLYAYTPTSITISAIQYGDRPYAAAISLKNCVIATDTIHQYRITTAITLGVIGQMALGDEIQTGIHRLTQNRLPKGWHNQIRNDAVINYGITYEMPLIQKQKFLLLSGMADLKAGTLNDRLSSGLNLMVGNFNDPYSSLEKSKKKAAFYLYGKSQINLIGYDASLQGGVFNHSSPYSIPSSQISRATFQNTAGISINWRSLYLNFYTSTLTKEFRTGERHKWAGFSLGISL